MIPISLFIDDASPCLMLDNKLLGKKVNPGVEFLAEFRDVVNKYGIRGKMSVIPNPLCMGRIDKSVPGFYDADRLNWIGILSNELSAGFDYAPEMITHANAWDVANEAKLDIAEDDWSQDKSAQELEAYISYALTVLKNVGLSPTGVSSPWHFGEHNEENYVAAIAASMKKTLGRCESWYFLHEGYFVPEKMPETVYNKDGAKVVNIAATVKDHLWKTQSEDISPERLADRYITENGRGGDIIEELKLNAAPVLVTHWQSLYSAGTRVGLAALNIVCERIEKHLGDSVQWTKPSEIFN